MRRMCRTRFGSAIKAEPAQIEVHGWSRHKMRKYEEEHGSLEGAVESVLLKPIGWSPSKSKMLPENLE